MLADLDGAIAAVLDGGATEHGLESTVVDARGDVPIVLREGAVSRERLLWATEQDGVGSMARAAGPAIVDTDADATRPARSPGLRHRHYAPDALVLLAEPDTSLDLVRRHLGTGERVGIVSRPDAARRAAAAGAEVLGRPEDAVSLAHVLFACLREADDLGLDVIVFETVPEVGAGRAVMDRLRRAAEASRRPATR